MLRFAAPSRLLSLAALAFSASIFVVPPAHADTIGVGGASGCSASGEDLCASDDGNAFSLNAFLDHRIHVGPGTQNFMVEDTTGSFSFIYTGSGSVSCQITGAAADFFSSCSTRNSGGPLFFGRDFPSHSGGPTVVTFTAKPGECTRSHPCFFDFSFVSSEGSGGGTGNSLPEPASLALLGSGLLSLIAFRRRLS